jgi:hypothetical protein
VGSAHVPTPASAAAAGPVQSAGRLRAPGGSVIWTGSTAASTNDSKITVQITSDLRNHVKNGSQQQCNDRSTLGQVGCVPRANITFVLETHLHELCAPLLERRPAHVRYTGELCAEGGTAIQWASGLVPARPFLVLQFSFW